MGHRDDQSINADAVRDHLEQLLSAGRNIGEAAGEILFLADKKVSSGVMSRSGRREYDDIVSQWIRARDVEGQAVHELTARLYSEHLTQQVAWDFSSHAIDQINAAFRAWRQRNR